MKQYFITSLYTQGVQVAVQQDHACKELMKNILLDKNQFHLELFNDYITNHKTTISLSVGQPTELLYLYSYMMVHKEKLNIPFGIFQEDSLNKTPTCLSFVATKKLGANIHFAVQNMLKSLNIFDLYGLENISDELFPNSFVCPISKVKIQIVKVNHKNYQFNVSTYERKKDDILYQNNLDLTDMDTIKLLYKDGNENDYLFFNSESEVNNENKSYDEVNFTYSIEELNFLLMIKSLRLK